MGSAISLGQYAVSERDASFIDQFIREREELAEFIGLEMAIFAEIERRDKEETITLNLLDNLLKLQVIRNKRITSAVKVMDECYGAYDQFCSPEYNGLPCIVWDNECPLEAHPVKIGEGSFSQVFSSVLLGLGPVAIKLFRSEDASLKLEILKEMSVADKMHRMGVQHENVVTCLGMFADTCQPDTKGLVYELVGDDDLMYRIMDFDGGLNIRLSQFAEAAIQVRWAINLDDLD